MDRLGKRGVFQIAFSEGNVAMNPVFKLVVIGCMSLLLAACKLAVIVPEGGEVQSIGSGTCSPGVVCIVEVQNTNFSDTFRAVPLTGWYFHKWNSGDRFFCSRSASPECELAFESTPGVEGNEKIRELVDSSETFYLMPVFKETPPEIKVIEDSPVEVDGKLWLQPIHFVNYSYDQIKEVCPQRVCSGSLPGSTIDLTGYLWANRDEVESLFFFYQSSARRVLDDFIYTLAEKDEELDQAVNLNLRVILGDDLINERWLGASVYDGQPFEPSPEEYGIGLNVFDPPSRAGEDLGAWFWKPL
jgi:hypothetical protein